MTDKEMSMRILVTNDDGINAPGLSVLEEIARQLAGQNGTVITVAPINEQSGVGHCISYTHPMRLTDHGNNRWAVEGSPADCVLAGIFEVMKDAKPDLLLSGINRGNNTSQNTLYSGTIGAAIEGVMHGVKSIALSQFLGPNSPKDDPFAPSIEHGVTVIKTLLDKAPWNTAPYDLFYNINFPPCAQGDTKGVSVVSQGFRTNTEFTLAPVEGTTDQLQVTGGPQHEPTAKGTDTHANLAGYISVTPMRCDLTAHDQMDATTKAFNQ